MLTVNNITLRWLFNPFLLCLWLPDRARWCERKIKPLLIMWDISEVTHLHSAPTPILPEKHMCHLGADIQAELENWGCHWGWKRNPSQLCLPSILNCFTGTKCLTQHSVWHPAAMAMERRVTMEELSVPLWRALLNPLTSAGQGLSVYTYVSP